MGLIVDKISGNPLLIDIKEADLDTALKAKVNQGKIAGIITTTLPSTGIITDKVYEFAGVQGVPITGGTIKDTNGATITTLQNGDSLWYNTATEFWYRIPFQNLANYYTKTEINNIEEALIKNYLAGDVISYIHPNGITEFAGNAFQYVRGGGVICKPTKTIFNKIEFKAGVEVSNTPVHIKIYKGNPTYNPANGLFPFSSLGSALYEITHTDWTTNYLSTRTILLPAEIICGEDDYIFITFATLTATRVIIGSWNNNQNNDRNFGIYSVNTDYINQFSGNWYKSTIDTGIWQVDPILTLLSPYMTSKIFETIKTTELVSFNGLRGNIKSDSLNGIIENIYDRNKASLRNYLSNGTLIANASFDTSDYIQIANGDTYTVPEVQGTSWVEIYDKKKVFLAGIGSGAWNNIISPYTFIIDNPLAVYMRCVFAKDYDDRMFANNGNLELSMIIKGSTYPTYFIPHKNVTEWLQNGDNTPFIIPRKIYKISGKDIILYLNGCTKTRNLCGYYLYSENAFSKINKLIYTLDNNGNKPLFKLFNSKLSPPVGMSSSKIIVSSIKANPVTQKTILCIGDSLTEMGYYVDEFKRMLTGTGGTPVAYGLSNFKFIGRKTTANGTKHEGTGGYKFESYTNNTGVNPFWIGGKVDFTAYVSSIGETTLDYVCILLGWNNFTAGDNAVQIGVKSKLLIDKIHYDYPSAKILLCSIPNTTPYQNTQSAIPEIINERNMQLCGEFDKISFDPAYSTFVVHVALACQFDSVNNYATEQIAVNPFNSATEINCTDFVHPTLEGGKQIGHLILNAFMSI